MALKVGINGFGRIGRMVLRSIIENNRKDLEIVAINNRGNSEVSSFLLKHDTIHGKLNAKIITLLNLQRKLHFFPYVLKLGSISVFE